MKLRRHIALLILAIYALASSGRAVESLTCRCICHSESHAGEGRCLICLHRHNLSGASAHCHVEDHDLCHHSHTSPQELYTLTQDDDRSPIRQSTMPAWAACMTDGYACATLTTSSTYRYGQRRVPLPRAFGHAPKALRAPPTGA